MSVRRRPPPRVAAAALPLAAAGSLHGAAIGFKPGRALPVGGPVTLKPEADEQKDPASQQELTPNLPTDVRELVNTMVWELKEGLDAARNAMYINYQAGTVWGAYMYAAKERERPKTPILHQPMERDDYEELKAMYDRHNLLTPEERRLMQRLENEMEWTEPYTPSAAYTARQDFHRQQNEEADAGAEAAARAELQRRFDTERIAEARKRQAEQERNAGGQEAFAEEVRAEVLQQDGALTAAAARREASELQEAERQSLQQFAADERRRQDRPRAASAQNLQPAFDRAAQWTSNDAADPQSVARTAPPSAPPHWADDFRQSEIGEWLHRTFAEISDITENVDVDDPQFALRTDAVMSRTGPYTVYTVEVYVPPFPGELAPRLGDGDRGQVHNMLNTWVRNLLRIVMRYKTEGQERQARDSARTLKQDIAQMQRRVDFQYKREVTSQFDMAVNYLIAELDPDEQVRRNAAMEMSSSLRPSGFAPPDERPPTATASAEDDDDAAADLQPSAFRQSAIGRWLYQTFGEIADIAKNVDPTDPQFATRSEAVLSRDGRYNVYAVHLYVPPFPGENAPHLGGEDSQEVHDMLHTWVQSLLSIVKWYQTAGEEMDASLSARALLGDISLSSYPQHLVNFQYKAEVMEQFYKAVKSLIAEFDPNEQTRRNAQMDMLGGAQLEPRAFIPPTERPPTAPAPAEDDDDAGLYHNDDGDAVTAWARGVTDRLHQLYEQGYGYERYFEQRIDEGQPAIDLNIWLRNSNRAPIWSEQDQLQAALHDWQRRAARLLQAWQRAVDQYDPQVGSDDIRFDEPRQLKSELIAKLTSAPDSDDVPNFIGQQRVYDVFAEYISWLDTIYEPSFSVRVTIPVIYEDQI